MPPNPLRGEMRMAFLGLFAPLKIRFSVHAFHATDFVNTSLTDFYRKKLPKIDPFKVTKHCHHQIALLKYDAKCTGVYSVPVSAYITYNPSKNTPTNY